MATTTVVLLVLAATLLASSGRLKEGTFQAKTDAPRCMRIQFLPTRKPRHSISRPKRSRFTRQRSHIFIERRRIVPYRYLLLVLSCFASSASAQDPFEIHIYEYEPLAWRQYSLEAHLNFVTQGNYCGRRNSVSYTTPDTLDA